MKALAIVLVGGAAKIAADGIFGVLALLLLYTRPKSRTKKKLFARVPPSKLLGKTKGVGYCSPVVALMAQFDSRMPEKAASL